MLECVINVSEGRRPDVIDAVARAAGASLLDVHHDEHHNRAVLTLGGDYVEDDARAVVAEGVARIDIREHVGAHPRLGAVDVVPFVPLAGSTIDDAVAARDALAAWAGRALGVPCFVYGPERSLPDVRRNAFVGLRPDHGPAEPHPTAGAIAVGGRDVLVAYNLWLTDPDIGLARAIARDLRGPAVRALAFAVGTDVQVSCNLTDPTRVGLDAVYDAVAARTSVARAELVGLLPAAVLDRVPAARWSALDLGADRTIESRLAGGSWFAGQDASPAGPRDEL